ncbi:Unannotated [Lentimonas sp. CC19]|nr:Unannotated [Lentimonas sp. CC10]CAA6697564.1 Unannotated [Lentimonas sp. CC19]CAA7072412.1 Unannotated [Lentimonas sp. CC11]
MDCCELWVGFVLEVDVLDAVALFFNYESRESGVCC